MWSSISALPLGGISMRQITLFALAIVMALFTSLTISTAPVYGQTPSGEIATWSGEDIVYGGTTLRRYDTPPGLQDARFPNRAGTPCENSSPLYYSLILEDPAVELADPEYREDRAWMHLICLDAGADGNDGTQTVGATLLDYSVRLDGNNADGLRGGDLDTVIEKSIQIFPEGTNPNTAADGTATTCSSEFTHGLGWIICPITNWLANMMDFVYKMLVGFLVVSPVSTNTNSAMYYMWNLMRNLANILFIIGFIIIIYSQTTSVGISNYGIKRLLPRLVIAAVLVNVSYWIVAVAVDLSNVLGVSIKGLLDTIQQNIPISESDAQNGEWSWSAIAGIALSGGAAVAGATGLVLGVFATAGASLYFLLPALMGVLVAALVAILVLAARQAIITILIIISPLAFVAYLLPSTERYFDRWRSLFMTMLLVFPGFSIVFGGAQLAGLAIIHSADAQSQNYYNLIILGLIVQVAPLVITPLLIKLSGSLIGRIAGIVNDPNRGMVDRTRKFAQDRHDMHKNSRMWERDQNNPKKYAHNGLLARSARRMALRERDRQNKIKVYEGGLEAAYEQDRRAHRMYIESATNEMVKSSGEDEAKSEFERRKADNEVVRRLYYTQQLHREEAETLGKQNSTRWLGMKAAPDVVAVGALERQLGERGKEIGEEAKSLAYRENAANLVQDSNYHTRLAGDEALQRYAGYDGVDPHGATRVASLAQEKEGNAYNTRVTAFLNTQKKVEATTEDRTDIARGITPSSPFSATIRHFADDVEGRAAAVRFVGEKSPVKDIHLLMRKLNLTETATGDEVVLRSELADITNRTVFVSSTNRSRIAEGKIDASLRGDDLMNAFIKETLDAGAFSVTGMASQIDRDDLHEAALFIQRERAAGRFNANTRAQLDRDLREAVTNPDYAALIDKRKRELREIWQALDMGPLHEKLQ